MHLAHCHCVSACRLIVALQCIYSLVSLFTVRAQKDVTEEKCEEGGNGDSPQENEPGDGSGEYLIPAITHDVLCYSTSFVIANMHATIASAAK